MTKLQTVIEAMLNDQGLMVATKVDLPQTFDDNGEKIDWQRVEKFLDTLTEEQLETFAVGEQEEIVRLAKGREGKYAHRALETLFLEIAI